MQRVLNLINIELKQGERKREKHSTSMPATVTLFGDEPSA